jgi:hypothetical protein
VQYQLFLEFVKEYSEYSGVHLNMSFKPHLSQKMGALIDPIQYPAIFIQ